MNYFYEWPNSRQEYNIFFKEVFRMPNFWKDLGKKLTFEVVQGGGDVACKLALWHFLNGGTWVMQDFIDYNIYKPLLSGLLAFGATGWLTVPFETAQRAYYADKTWPLELRRNYTSPTNALLRIPFEEGPFFLLKGGFPLVANQTAYFTAACFIYHFFKTKFFFLHVYHDYNYNYLKAVWLGAAHFLATCIAYPFYFTREMVDLWPKERGGFCTWNNSYRQCVKWMVTNMDIHFYNYMRGMTTWQYKYGYKYFIMFWMADNLGLFTSPNEELSSAQIFFDLNQEYA